jgi:hypothetical protein
MRSVLEYYTNSRNIAPQLHLVVSDVPAKQCSKKAAPLRLAQLPQWLDASQVGNWHHGKMTLTVWYHAQLFPSYVDSVFHSYAIGESTRDCAFTMPEPMPTGIRNSA